MYKSLNLSRPWFLHLYNGDVCTLRPTSNEMRMLTLQALQLPYNVVAVSGHTGALLKDRSPPHDTPEASPLCQAPSGNERKKSALERGMPR